MICVNITWKKKVNLEVEFTKKLDDFKPDLIAVSALSDESENGFKLSAVAKKWNKNLPVVWGNKAPTMNPERILGNENVDYICIGEGIEFIPEFVNCLASKNDPKKLYNIAFRNNKGNIVKNKIRPFFQNLDSLPFFDLSVFDYRQFVKPYDGNAYIGGDHMI